MRGPASAPGTLHDPHRDATTLSLIPRAVEQRRAGVRRVPRLPGNERRMGGTLHQRVHEVAGLDDHREDKEQPLDVQYGPAHEVVLEPGGLRADRRAGTHHA